ncbi:hypothetical protein [Xanthomonas oryzae]|nr:hypothetical protein [Xanthomonas oryzae]
MNGLLRMIAVPACAGISSACFFLIPLIGSDYPYDGGRLGALVFFAIFGGMMGFIVGCPIILFVDWKWRQYRFRYVVSALLGAILGWLLLDGAFAKNAWINIWSSKYFWFEVAPKRLLGYSIIGLASGLLYTGVVAAINRFVPEIKGPSKPFPD